MKKILLFILCGFYMLRADEGGKPYFPPAYENTPGKAAATAVGQQWSRRGEYPRTVTSAAPINNFVIEKHTPTSLRAVREREFAHGPYGVLHENYGYGPNDRTQLVYDSPAPAAVPARAVRHGETVIVNSGDKKPLGYPNYAPVREISTRE